MGGGGRNADRECHPTRTKLGWGSPGRTRRSERYFAARIPASTATFMTLQFSNKRTKLEPGAE
jgi:hypothetical protein